MCRPSCVLDHQQHWKLFKTTSASYTCSHVLTSFNTGFSKLYKIVICVRISISLHEQRTSPITIFLYVSWAQCGCLGEPALRWLSSTYMLSKQKISFYQVSSTALACSWVSLRRVSHTLRARQSKRHPKTVVSHGVTDTLKRRRLRKPSDTCRWDIVCSMLNSGGTSNMHTNIDCWSMSDHWYDFKLCAKLFIFFLVMHLYVYACYHARGVVWNCADRVAQATALIATWFGLKNDQTYNFVADGQCQHPTKQYTVCFTAANLVSGVCKQVQMYKIHEIQGQQTNSRSQQMAWHSVVSLAHSQCLHFRIWNHPEIPLLKFNPSIFTAENPLGAEI